MDRKSTIIGLTVIIIVAGFVYGISHFVMKSVTKDDASPKSTVDILENGEKDDMKVSPGSDATEKKEKNDKSDDINTQNVIETDAFESFKTTGIDDIIMYANEFRQITLTAEEEVVNYDKNGKIKVEFKAPCKIDSETVFYVDFSDKENGMIIVFADAAAGSSYYEVYYTNDGGKTWTDKAILQVAGAIEDVYVIDEKRAFLVSTASAIGTEVIYYTENSGKSFFMLKNAISEMENGVIYPVCISKDEVSILDVVIINDESQSAVMYKMDSEWNIVDRYDVKK